MSIALQHMVSPNALVGMLAAGAAGLMAGVLACRVAERGAQGTLRHPSRLRMGMAALCGCGCFGAVTAVYGLTLQAAELCLFCTLLIHLSLTDLDRSVIPDADVAAAAAVRMGYLLLRLLRGSLSMGEALAYVMGAVCVGAALLVAVLACDRALGIESMGGGDLKLFAVAALYVGWEQALLLVALACLLGLGSAAALAQKTSAAGGWGHAAFPFGPAIALACVITLMVGSDAVAWYQGLLAVG